MMLYCRLDDVDYRVDCAAAADLSIPLQFDGPQPNHFGAPPASAEALAGDGFFGDTRRGGSCNCEVYRLVPHCNGTHTECIGHVTDQRVPIGELAREGWLACALVSVEPIVAERAGEDSEPTPAPADRLITAAAIRAALARLPSLPWRAVAIRTLPNVPAKRTRRYEAADLPPYLSAQAAAALVERGIEHLLIDLPSLDKMHDQGRLTAHRIFWGLPPGSRDAAAARRPRATVTELIYAPDEIRDGAYLLDLQLPRFATDAAPSRPLLYPLEHA